MPDPFTTIIAGYITAKLPQWLTDIRSILFDKSKTYISEKGKVWLNEKQQQLHMEQVLKKAVKRSLTKFRKLAERDQYKAILMNLFETGLHSDTLRQEAMALFTLTDTPNITELNEIYNRSLRFRNLSQPTPPAEIDAAPYLISFFDALIAELYIDPFFKNQVSNAIQTRAAMLIPQQLTQTNTTLLKIHEVLKNDYSEEQFQMRSNSAAKLASVAAAFTLIRLPTAIRRAGRISLA